MEKSENKQLVGVVLKTSEFLPVTLVLTLLLSLLIPLVQSPVRAVVVPILLFPDDESVITAAGTGDYASPPVAIPEFRWEAIEGAKIYRIQFSQDIAFTTKFEYTTPFIRFTPTKVSQFNDGRWYWRVRVETPAVSEYSLIWAFTRRWASSDNAPVLLQPSDGAALEFFATPNFSWEPVIGAGSYRFQISTAADFTTLAYNQVTLATTHQPKTKLANGDYYWRVIPRDPEAREGTSSAVRSFSMQYNRIPQLIEPANNSFPTFTPTFHWTAVVGAQSYDLQYSTDPSFNTDLNSVSTNNPSYTPTATLPNDVNYYWRVRARSGASISGWSQVWTFRKQWYIRPVLLTPTNNYQDVRIPFFSWTPVPGASYYKIELDKDLDFINLYDTETTTNNYFTPNKYDGIEMTIYWRVIPFDGSGKRGKESLVFSYRSSQNALAPDLVYPYFYYLPNNFPAPDQGVAMQPHVDRTAPYPLFRWHRMTVPYPVGGVYAAGYRLQVSTDPLMNSLVWQALTENTHAAPTVANPFFPIPNTDYFWRVRPLDLSGVEIGPWSQIWITRFDPAKGIQATGAGVPALVRPTPGMEFADATPALEWQPVIGADTYQVQISWYQDFISSIVDQQVNQPIFSPLESLAQRFYVDRNNFGTYYWRVRAGTGGSWGSWSETGWFTIAAQSEWKETRSLGDSTNRLIIAEDQVEPVAGAYDLRNLYAAQDEANWYFGFDLPVGQALTDVVYLLYLDQDNQLASGATLDPLGYSVTSIPIHYPEYALFIPGSFDVNQIRIYTWDGQAAQWNPGYQILGAIGGGVFTDLAAGFLELRLPNTAIGMRIDTGSYSTALFSAPLAGGLPLDSIPTSPAIPGGSLLSHFAAVSEHVNPLVPPNSPEFIAEVVPFVLPFEWDFPTGCCGASPWAGAKVEVHLDPKFTSKVADYLVESTGSYYSSFSYQWPSDLQGDNSYYWRAQPRYLKPSNKQVVFGSWSQGWRFERTGFLPANMQESVSFATPTFSWDIVEGARAYDLEVDNDPNFGSPAIDIRTTQNSYTWTSTLSNGVYYWRVRVTRGTTSSSVFNAWSPVRTFTLTLPLPTGLTPNESNPANAISAAPTFCWQPVLQSSGSYPVLAAYKYRLQVSKGDPTFSSIYETADTEQTCYTPVKGYDDGAYYWRVAMLDGDSHLGGYSTPAQFTKQYPPALPLSPVSGGSINQTPTFTWTAFDGHTPYVFGAASYRLQVSKTSTFATLYENITTNNTRYTPTKVYDLNTLYYWRVAIIDADGKFGPYSDATILLDPDAGKLKVFLPVVRK
jgi:hypothetical protein